MFVNCPHCQAKNKIDINTEQGTELQCSSCGKGFQHSKSLIHVEEIRLDSPQIQVNEHGFRVNHLEYPFEDIHIVTFKSGKDQKRSYNIMLVWTWGATLIGIMLLGVPLIAYFKGRMDLDISTIIYMIFGALMALILGPLSVMGSLERFSLRKLDPNKAYAFDMLSKSQGQIRLIFEGGVALPALEEIQERVLNQLLQQPEDTSKTE